MHAKLDRLGRPRAALLMISVLALAGCGESSKTDQGGGADNPILARQRGLRLNDLNKIGIAVSKYESIRRQFPPAAQRGADGKPLLSWRVLILPHLDQDDLYGQFHLDEPWDSKHNGKLIDKIPSVYAGGRKDGKTSIMVFMGPKAPFGEARGPSRREFTDGLSNTIFCVEAGPDVAVPWTKPEDLTFDPNDPVAALGDVQSGEFLAIMFDGMIYRFPTDIDAKVLAALINPADGEMVDPRKHEIKSR